MHLKSFKALSPPLLRRNNDKGDDTRCFSSIHFSFRMYEALEKDPKAAQTIWPKNNADNDLMYHKRALHFHREEKKPQTTLTNE